MAVVNLVRILPYIVEEFLTDTEVKIKALFLAFYKCQKMFIFA